MRTQRAVLLYGLSGLFTLVVGGLILAEPTPLTARGDLPDASEGRILAATVGRPELERSVKTNLESGIALP